MAKGSFDNEIRQAMTPSSGAPSAKQPAPFGASSGQKSNAPTDTPPATKSSPRDQLGLPKPGLSVAVRMPTGSGASPVDHAASIAHAILQHGRMMP